MVIEARRGRIELGVGEREKKKEKKAKVTARDRESLVLSARNDRVVRKLVSINGRDISGVTAGIERSLTFRLPVELGKSPKRIRESYLEIGVTESSKPLATQIFECDRTHRWEQFRTIRSFRRVR